MHCKLRPLYPRGGRARDDFLFCGDDLVTLTTARCCQAGLCASGCQPVAPSHASSAPTMHPQPPSTMPFPNPCPLQPRLLNINPPPMGAPVGVTVDIRGHGSNGRQYVKKYDNWNYCSSCGYDVKNNHTSTNYPAPKRGHNFYATRRNPMGGSC